MSRRTTGHRKSYQEDIWQKVVLSGQSSNFSPVPIRVMDGSEPGVDTPAAVLSGAPVELQARTVRYT